MDAVLAERVGSPAGAICASAVELISCASMDGLFMPELLFVSGSCLANPDPDPDPNCNPVVMLCHVMMMVNTTRGGTLLYRYRCQGWPYLPCSSCGKAPQAGTYAIGRERRMYICRYMQGEVGGTKGQVFKRTTPT